MTGCCAFGCSNKSEKGYKMYRFPADPQRRKIWENKVSRGVGWKPTSSSCLCEVTAEDTHPDAQLTMLKEFKTGCLLRVSDKTFKMILTVEAMFREAEDKLMDEKNVKSVLLERAQELTEDVKFADCHNIKRKLLAKFITSRLHFFCKKQTGNRKKESSKKFNELGSKSMAMRKLAAKVK